MPESKRRKPKKPAESRPRQATSTKREPSPKWYVVTMAGLMAVGVLLVLIRFVFSLDQLWLLAGLVLIAGGFLMTTNYR
jgi:uncharacterized membrane protein HdeD (DUF308 family)